jgi:hypothetical protein
MPVKCSKLLLLCNPIIVSAVVNRHTSALHTNDAALAAGSTEMDAEMSAELRATLDAMVGSMIRQDGNSPNVAEAMRTVASKMDVKAAAQKLEHKNLPKDVVSLVRTATSGSSTQPFSEASLDKARVVLNGMVEASWKEMDDKIIECKEFEEQNRGTFEQVTTDISRLVEQISDLQRIESESINGISATEQEISDVEASLAEETKIYQQIYAVNAAEMVVRQNDLDVFTFILQFTKCADATSLLQNEHGESTRICQTHSGKNVLHFSKKEQQHKYDKMLSPRARKLVSDLLGAVQERHTSLLQVDQPMNTTTAVPPPVVETPVAGEDGSDCMSSGDPSDCMKSCPPTPPDCGLLHDKLSLMWGDYKDKVDELQMEMNKNQYEFEELKFNLNDQLRVLTSTKARFSMQLSESRSNMAADRQEKMEKEAQKADLDRDYYAFMKACKKRITWIMYQDMCAIIVVRNAVLETSTVCPSASIDDCDLDAWIPSECSVSCDDACPDPMDPYACGGWQEIKRKVVVPPDSCGLQCPDLSRFKKCNQLKCPVNCEMSEWSGWSKCTADCEGGVQAHTRSILTKPKNGGEFCNTVEESRPCNTMSCDRDCTMAPWTSWTPCSMACDGGFQERFRHVLIPTRGFGKCPTPTSDFRYAKQECNVHACTGDEMCIAKQDLILGVDGSGSLTEDGFGILRNFAVKLITKYQTEYFGSDAMKVGVLQFGNGVVLADGRTVSPAINVQPLTTDLALVKAGLENLPYKKGFTNMAQAFALSEVMYTAAGRKGAQSALLLITDGKPSFAFQTNEMVQQLQDKNVQRFFMVVNEAGGDDLKQMQNWASQPWETNLIHVPGLEALRADENVWVQKAVVMFCPMSLSPTATVEQEQIQGYMMVKESGYCGDRGQLLSKDVQDAAGCAYLAQGAGSSAFLVGTWFRRGYCYTSPLAVDADMYRGWESDRVNPACSAVDGWTQSQLYDFYALEPTGYNEGPSLVTQG